MFIRQIVGFAILVAFLWVLGFIHGLFGATGMPDLLAWILAVAVELVAVAGLFAGWQWLQARRILSKPGVREWKDLDDRAFALHKRGDLAAAEPLYEQALPEAEKTGQPLMVANAAKDAYDFLGSPEGELAIAEAVIYVATAPKSNAAYTAYGAAMRAAFV